MTMPEMRLAGNMEECGILGRVIFHVGHVALVGRAALVGDVHFQMLAAGRGKNPILSFHDGARLAADGFAIHHVSSRLEEIAERTRRIGGVFSQSANHQLNVRPLRILHRGGQKHEAVGALAQGRALGIVDGDAVDEDHSQVAVFGRAFGGGRGCPARGQEGLERRVGHREVQLEAGLVTLFDQRFGPSGGEDGHKEEGKVSHRHAG